MKKKILGYILLLLGLTTFSWFAISLSTVKDFLVMIGIVAGIGSYSVLVAWLLTDKK